MTTSSPTNTMPVIAQKVADQVVSSIKSGQQMTVDAAAKWSKVIAILPLPELPRVPGLVGSADIDAMTTVGFDLADQVLQAQREFARSLTQTVPSTPSA